MKRALRLLFHPMTGHLIYMESETLHIVKIVRTSSNTHITYKISSIIETKFTFLRIEPDFYA
jgi:protease II